LQALSREAEPAAAPVVATAVTSLVALQIVTVLAAAPGLAATAGMPLQGPLVVAAESAYPVSSLARWYSTHLVAVAVARTAMALLSLAVVVVVVELAGRIRAVAVAVGLVAVARAARAK